MQNIKPMQYNAYPIYFWLSGLYPIWLAGETGMYIYFYFPRLQTINVYSGPNFTLLYKFYPEKLLRHYYVIR